MTQFAELQESPTALYFGTGSEGTLAGVAVGAGTFSAPWRTIGVSVSETAARLHVSERHLRRLVRQETGMAPREMAS